MRHSKLHIVADTLIEYLHKQKSRPSRRPTKKWKWWTSDLLAASYSAARESEKNRKRKSKPQGLNEETTTTTD